MTHWVLRWLSVVSMVWLVVDAVWLLGAFGSGGFGPFALNLAYGSTAGVLTSALVFSSGAAVCNLTGIATLLVSARRREWGWFAGVLLCLAVFFYGNVVLYFPSSFAVGRAVAARAFGTPSVLAYSRIVSFYESVMIVAPIIVLSLVYAWTRRRSSLASATGQEV